MQDNILKQLITLVEKKFNLNKEIGEKTFPGIDIEQWLKGETYLRTITDEIEEVEQELRKGNSIYLEDELGDILWTYMNMLHCFEKEGYINQKKVFERCLKKYTERTNGMEKGIPWNDIKSLQKKELLDEYNTKHEQF